jgi:uncharacterized protein
MKAFFLAVSLAVLWTLIATGTAQATTPRAVLGQPEPAQQFVESLAKGDFAAAEAQFDPTMKGALSGDKLRDTWQAVVKQVGPFQKQLLARTDRQAGYKIVTVTCQFEKAALDARVVFDAKGQVAGLSFAPAAPEASAFKTPPYAKPEAYVETGFTVGTGEWKLPGTLTMPRGAKGKVPAVVLVHGSGAEDRDETVVMNKPFRDLAWGLASRGIAVLRYEKRTQLFGQKLMAQGIAGFTVKEESIDDAVAAAGQLRNQEGVDAKRIFVLGHSLGATIAPRIAQADPHLAGLVLMAGATRPIEDIAIEQIRYGISLSGPLSKEDQAEIDKMIAEISSVKKLTPADRTSATLIYHAPASYWLDLREHDPVAIAKEIKTPMLILQGGRDYQATEADFAGWKAALSGRPNVTLKLYPDLNHLFIQGTGKSKPAEYDTAGNMEESVIAEIGDWILKTPPVP